ncbi:MAG TPA: hypothetical protein VLC46_15280 [Thermoanaerobaculia bacterium]|jgi:hypothetical protein|nr:hypothetical protein [Thermoanaerobaculia bacterium]
MNRFRTSLALALLAFSLPALASDGKVDGSLTANGKTVALKHAYAQMRKDPFDKKKIVLQLIFTDQELSPAAASDDMELMQAQDKQQLNGFTATIDADKQIISGTVFSPAFKKMKQFSATGMQKINLTAMTDTHVAGSIGLSKPDDFFDERYQYNATFDLPVGKPAGPAPPPALKGTPLSAGGGEPGKAYLAYLKVLAGGDMKAFLGSVAAARAKEASSDPDFKKLFPMLQAMQPKGVKVTGGAINGNNATLIVTGKDDNQVSNGTITMVKEGGAWKVEKEEWKTGGE